MKTITVWCVLTILVKSSVSLNTDTFLKGFYHQDTIEGIENLEYVLNL